MLLFLACGLGLGVRWLSRTRKWIFNAWYRFGGLGLPLRFSADVGALFASPVLFGTGSTGFAFQSTGFPKAASEPKSTDDDMQVRLQSD